MEDLERQINVLGRPVSTHTHGHRVLWDEVIPSKSASEPPSIHVQSLATVPKSPVPQKPQDRGKRPDFTYNAMSSSQKPTPSQKGSSGDQEVTARLLTAGFQMARPGVRTRNYFQNREYLPESSHMERQLPSAMGMLLWVLHMEKPKTFWAN